MIEADMDLSIALEQALATLTENDIGEILSAVDPVSWIESRRVLKGKPFSFIIIIIIKYSSPPCGAVI